jgi:hypothetical protein
MIVCLVRIFIKKIRVIRCIRDIRDQVFKTFGQPENNIKEPALTGSTKMTKIAYVIISVPMVGIEPTFPEGTRF